MDYDGLTNIVDVYIRHLRSKIHLAWSRYQLLKSGWCEVAIRPFLR